MTRATRPGGEVRRRARRAAALGGLFALAPLLSVCGDSVTGPLTDSAVDAVVPGPQSIGAPTDTDIVVTFRQTVTPAQLLTAGNAVFGRWSGPVPGVWQLESDGTVARFSPSRSFMAGEWVTVRLPRGVAGGFEWGFWAASAPATMVFGSPDVRSARDFSEGRIRSYGAYAGDLNGDGWSDLMIPNEDANDFRVFLNDASGDYDSFTSYAIPSGNRPSTNEGVDLDNDGDTDLVIGNSRNQVLSVFLNQGDGSYLSGGSHDAGEQIRGVCVADFDVDGNADVITANRVGDGAGNVTLFIGNGTGGFESQTTFEAGVTGETACAVGDADLDGRPDVFIGGIGSGEIVVLINDGSGQLSIGSRTPAGGGPWMLASGDLNGDGMVDVVSANEAQGEVAVLFGDGRGGLGSPTTYTVGARPLAVDLGDIDGDGDLDVVTSNFEGVDWTVYENVGAGVLGNPNSYPASSAGSCATLHDRDNDGDLDMTGIDELDDLIYLFPNGG